MGLRSMTKENIGQVVCPVCKSNADVRLSKSGFAYVFCHNDCNIQIFTRNKYQHEKLVSNLINKSPDVVQKPAVKPAEVPALEVPKKAGLLID